VQPSARLLEAIEIFQGIPSGELESLAKRFRWMRYDAGQQIISHMDDSTDVFLVVEGTVRVIIFSASGKEVAFRDIGAGEHFGELAAIDGLPRSATVAALTDCAVASMSAEVFWDILKCYPEVATPLIRQLASSVRALTGRVFEFSALAVKNRIHAELLRLARDHMTGENAAVVRPAPTHAEIASRISTNREAVTRELNQLSRDGLVERQSGALVVRDVARLARLVENAASS
jgi:CRP-like cAMP-binding protein